MIKISDAIPTAYLSAGIDIDPTDDMSIFHLYPYNRDDFPKLIHALAESFNPILNISIRHGKHPKLGWINYIEVSINPNVIYEQKPVSTETNEDSTSSTQIDNTKQSSRYSNDTCTAHFIGFFVMMIRKSGISFVIEKVI